MAERKPSLDGTAVAVEMRDMPVNDFMTKNGVVREDGRLVVSCICSASSRRKSRGIGSTTTDRSRRIPGMRLQNDGGVRMSARENP